MSSPWTPELDNALRRHVEAGISVRKAAPLINREFKTSFGPNACIGRAWRIGITSDANGAAAPA